MRQGGSNQRTFSRNEGVNAQDAEILQGGARFKVPTLKWWSTCCEIKDGLRQSESFNETSKWYCKKDIRRHDIFAVVKQERGFHWWDTSHAMIVTEYETNCTIWHGFDVLHERCLTGIPDKITFSTCFKLQISLLQFTLGQNLIYVYHHAGALIHVCLAKTLNFYFFFSQSLTN